MMTTALNDGERNYILLKNDQKKVKQTGRMAGLKNQGDSRAKSSGCSYEKAGSGK